VPIGAPVRLAAPAVRRPASRSAPGQPLDDGGERLRLAGRHDVRDAEATPQAQALLQQLTDRREEAVWRIEKCVRIHLDAVAGPQLIGQGPQLIGQGPRGGQGTGGHTDRGERRIGAELEVGNPRDRRIAHPGDLLRGRFSEAAPGIMPNGRRDARSESDDLDLAGGELEQAPAAPTDQERRTGRMGTLDRRGAALQLANPVVSPLKTERPGAIRPSSAWIASARRSTLTR
jgi:hypothetical protein